MHHTMGDASWDGIEDRLIFAYKRMKLKVDVRRKVRINATICGMKLSRLYAPMSQPIIDGYNGEAWRFVEVK